jgi:hypothetical protein
MEDTMRNVRVLRMFGYGASLALVLALSAPGVPGDIGGSHTAFAQGTGQPSPGQPDPGQPDPGQPGSGDPGAGQTPNQAPGTTNETTSSPSPSDAPNQQGTGSGTGQPGTGTGAGTGTQQGSGTGAGTGTTTQQGTGTGASGAGTMRDPTRGGSEVPGQPACYMPAANVTERKPYNMFRPACFGHLQ